MASAVAAAIDERTPLVVEAGTGVGKTYAYLVPALLSGARTLLSTATKTLQDQLFVRDLPRLRDALGVPVTIALLKGRSSYLCSHRLGLARHDAQLPDRFAVRALARIEAWAQTTVSGDLAELEGLDERSSILPLVTSSRENCLGSDCPQFKGCHVNKARRDAMVADLVVVNHHLFFADVSLRDSGVAELLPSVEVAVFDEAHQLGEAGVQFLGTILGSSQLIDFARDMLGAGLQQARGLLPWPELAAACDRSARDLRLAAVGRLGEVRASLKLRWAERSEDAAFVAGLKQVGEACEAAREALETVSELAPDFVRLAERAARLAALATRFALPAEDGKIRWLDLTAQQARLVESPLDIREAMKEEMQGAPKAWIFTSATLGDDAKLSWFTEGAGLEEATTLRVGSPFDYANHARVYVPRVFAKPGDPGHAIAVADLAGRCARALGGRTFVLTTTLRSLQAVGARLRDVFLAEASAIEVLVQGQGSKRQLMQRFLEAPQAVLVGSQSFWEGIDVPGEALQCVVIDKLPFPPPNDPLVEARVRRLEGEGRNAFTDYFVAEAAISLKQGAGRLIRSESDRGLLVVCDPRMAAMAYGRRLFAALPPMARLERESEAIEWLGVLAAAPLSA
ncbi:MAG: ATP-dependent DNA helicase [Burkholderiales bacterium]|nr:ATP-dependent DNA helicase [Burkholderiales bacterium]